MSRFRPSESGLVIAAVVATHNRADLLADRALASVAGQARPPDFLIVVDDSDARERQRNAEIVDALALPATKRVYLGNYRTPGACGAWNTALAWLLAAVPDCFVAVLDDDDAWDSAYLARCEAAALAHDLDMAAAGLVFHKTATDAGIILPPPESLNASDFLTGNPHIQGSSLFARLTTLLKAGGFDEGLRSTTDRDLCIRLADLGTVRYAAVAEHLVHHYAEPNRERLSTPGADAKRAGLAAFYRKHGARMTDEQRRVFMQRSRDRFDCDPALPPPAASPETPPGPAPDTPGGRLVLLVGAITSPDVDKVARLMGDLIAHYLPRRDLDLRMLLLENGGADAAVRVALQSAVADATGRGLAVQLIALEQQAADGADAVDSIRSIARSRTLLQRHLYREAQTLPDAVVWIVDDDCRVDNDHALDHIKRFRKDGAEVVLGMVTGAPPLPFLSCVRTQLVDLYHNLEQLARLQPDAPYPRRSNENAVARRRVQNYYYDLSRRETSHLESPFWYEPAGDSTVGAAFTEMVDALPGILSGVQVFRPLVVDDAALIDPVADAQPSVHRGPTTFVFDSEALRDFPNAVPTMEYTDLRRSDMVWCLLNKFVGNRQVVQAPLLVRQSREAADLDAVLDSDKLATDVRGYALYSCMRDVFDHKASTHDSRQNHGVHRSAMLDFDRDDMVLALSRFRKYLHERMNAFALSYFRIRGLLQSFDRYVNRDKRGDFWWLADERYADAMGALRHFVTQTQCVYAAFDIDEFRRRIAPDNDDIARVREYFHALPLIIEQHRADCRLPAEQLTAQAAEFIRREFEAGELCRLGIGGEGIVFTDGKMAYKYFHDRNKPGGGPPIAFLESQVGKWRDCATLYPILQVRRRGDEAALVYPYERGEPYTGGHLDGIVRFLRECRAAGIVCNNVHPDNFIVVDGGLKLVDYGADIMPFTEDRFLHMCQRAFLMYRFHDWSGLRHIMRRALRDNSLPHLAGFAHFLRQIAPEDEKAQLDRLLLDMALTGEPATVFDYGCGKGKLAEVMAARGLQVTAYDIDSAVINRCRSRAGSVRYLDADVFSTPDDAQVQTPARFDAVVCSLVLCTIEAPATFAAVLADLRKLVAARGRVIVAVCNPFYTFADDGESPRRHLPTNATYRSVFAYRKDMPATGRSRRDVHRPFDFYIQAFVRAGLVVKQVQETQSADAARLWPASDFLVFDLRPAPVARARVSLLIKTCYMEWRTIERLVRHKARQLTVPGGFLETVVIVDSRRDGFLRQYDAADPAAHRAAMRRLLDDGVVEEVIHAPEDAATMTATYRSWFGAGAAETHAANGQQIFATLYGFDACRGDYVLHMDSDVLIGRPHPAHDYLADMIGVLERDPRALFVSLPVPGAAKPYRPAGSDGRPWGVDPRCGLFDRRRLQAVRPLPNEVGGDGRWQLAWHRACNRLIAGSDFRAYRGGDPSRAFFFCVPNKEKPQIDRLGRVIDRIEQNFYPPRQEGKVELAGGDLEWAGPKRNEPYIFIICGRNVEAGRFRRCFDSLLGQSETGWGAVIVDDASDNGLGDYIGHLIASHRDRVTFIRNAHRRRTMHNTWDAIANFCGDPQSVIITLDADDALIGCHALARVRREYDAGADATVGSMLRLDKETDYIPDFNDPRGRRGGNVWQHLRTFRKHLFDAIDVDDLKRDGEWIDPASDWAFMLPIIEMARRPAHIPDLLYLYEPATPGRAASRQERDAVIRDLVARPHYLPADSSPPKCPTDRGR